MNPENTCKNCRFWAQDKGEETMGECRRSFPRHMDGEGHAKWLATFEGEWCGSFGPKKVAKEPRAPGPVGRPQLYPDAEMVAILHEAFGVPVQAATVAMMARVLISKMEIARGTAYGRITGLIARDELKKVGPADGAGSSKYYCPSPKVSVVVDD